MYQILIYFVNRFSFNRISQIGLIIFLLTACSTTPPTRFYTLSVQMNSTENSLRTAMPQQRIGIGPLNLPKYLDRLQIVTRNQQNRLTLAEFDQWAEPLDDAMIREITQGLSQELPQHTFYAYPWDVFGTMNYRVAITFNQFDGVLGEQLNAELRWVVIDEKTNQTVYEGHERWHETMNGKNYAALTSAMNAALEHVTEVVAQSLVSLPGK